MKLRLAILGILLLCCSCAETEHKPAQYKIGVSQCANDMWRQITMIQMEAEVTKHPDITLISKIAYNNTQEQVKQIRELIDEGVNLLIVSPNEQIESITEITAEAYRKGIPTVIWDRKIDSDEYSTFISADNYEIGTAVGRYISANLAPGSTILEISGLESSSPARERHQGFIDAIQGKGYVVRSIDGNWIPDVARARVEDIGLFEDIDLVFGHNDDMTIAAYEVISKYSQEDADRIKFIGIDAIVGIDAVIDGRLDASFLYPPGGDFVVKTAIKLLKGEQVEKNYVLKSSLVDASNASTLKAQSEQMLEYQKHINTQKKELEDIRNNHAMMAHFLFILIMGCIILLTIVVMSLVTTRKIMRKNRALLRKNEEVEQKTNDLIAQNIQIELLSNQKLQFFTNISHEIRTPLTLILNPLDKIEKAVKDPLIQKDVRTLRHNARHLLKIVNQLLDFRKIENNKKTLSVQETDLISFISEIVRYFETYAQSEKIVYSFNSDIKQLMLWIDRTKMEQVFINLISNAFKHSKKYGVITISVTEDENKAIVEVHDTGTGMDENTLQHIFDRFYSVGNTQNHGIGIGLHLSKEYAELHSGKLYAKSQLGSFSSFYVEIPKGKDYLPEDTLFVDASMVEDAMITNDEAVKEILARKYDDVVLIAEDDADIRTYLQEELSENFNTLVASNGYEATQLLLDNNVSVVLSDVLMPHINGYQLCREVKTNIATSHIPVILLTALTDESQMVHGVAEGADEYIRKPFNINYIKIKIINILEERRQLKEAFAREFNADKILDVEVKDIPCADDIFRDNLMDYMENNFENSEVGVDEMSSALGLSRVHLYRKTKSSFGLSPTDLLKKFRLRKAALLLKKDAGLSVSEVAYMTGFSSPAYFTRCFKEMFGVPPTAYDK